VTTAPAVRTARLTRGQREFTGRLETGRANSDIGLHNMARKTGHAKNPQLLT
jgi:hypothetical protein